jgi:hypothetical protein
MSLLVIVRELWLWWMNQKWLGKKEGGTEQIRNGHSASVAFCAHPTRIKDEDKYFSIYEIEFGIVSSICKLQGNAFYVHYFPHKNIFKTIRKIPLPPNFSLLVDSII